MPRTDIPPATTSRTAIEMASGGSEVTGDPSNDHSFANDGKTLLVIRNSGSTSRTVEAVIQQTVDGVTPAVKSYTITNAMHAIVGPFPVGVYGSTCQINVDHAEVMFQTFALGV